MVVTPPATSVASGGQSITARRLSGRGRHQWDERAALLDGSILSSSGQLRVWVTKRFPRMSLRRFEILGSGDHPVGLCAVAVGHGGGRFLDRLLLEADSGQEWGHAMAAVLDQLPPGRYVYGSEENLEAPREPELAQLDGVEVVDVRPLVVHSVEFGQWPSWEAYLHDVSTNVKRNAKRALARLPDLEIEIRTGRATLPQLVPLTRLRSEVFRRKGIAFSPVKAFTSAVGNVLTDSDRSFVALARGGGQVLAAFRGVEFGRTTTYLDGGSSARNQGASWFMLMAMIEGAYRRHPTGRMVMGYLDRSLHDEALGGGLLRQRRSCRAREVDTSIVTFDWAGRSSK